MITSGLASTVLFEFVAQLLLKVSILGLVREQKLFHPDHMGLNVSLNRMGKPDSSHVAFLGYLLTRCGGWAFPRVLWQ